MPRSDDWTIHMPPVLIKRPKPSDIRRIGRKQSPQPLVSSHCPTRRIRGFKRRRGSLAAFEKAKLPHDFFCGWRSRSVVFCRSIDDPKVKQLKSSLN
jgi:hypothetical protein